MITDASYGIIPYRLHENACLFLLIQHTGGHWSFPKGHKEFSETDLEAAERELREETGISTVEVDGSRSFLEHYVWNNGEEMVDKRVTFFVGRTIDREIRIQPEEIRGYAWLPFEEAMARLTYPETKQILTSAYEYLVTSKPLPSP